MFEREDWTLFRNLTTLGQKAGVNVEKIPALVAKELVDNALDAAGSCSAGHMVGNGLFVQDSGDGIPGSDAEVAAIFSVNRPLVSSKLLRLPTRGALGNGLRVVAGAVLSTDGGLTVSTRGRRLRLSPRFVDGHTDFEVVGDYGGAGTRVEVFLGESAPVRGGTLAWAKMAIDAARAGGAAYAGRSSPHWFDEDSFVELLAASRERTVRDLISEFEGCTGRKAGEIAAPYIGRLARSLSRSEAVALLGAARDAAKAVNPKRMGAIGPKVDGFPCDHAKADGIFEPACARGLTRAAIPCVVEAWVAMAEESSLKVMVNRTPVPAEMGVYYNAKKKRLVLEGCGLYNAISNFRYPVRAIVNVQTPYMPITSDGKAPDLEPVVGLIADVVTKAARRAKDRKRLVSLLNGEKEALTQKDVILDCLPPAIAKAGESGAYRFSLRQLFYAVRPYVLERLEVELKYNYFADVITDHEAEAGRDIPGMYRDNRGTLYHPHTSRSIPLGTIGAESYARPDWTFNKILYCEKEGFFPILQASGWPERHDCALMTSKGYASRAARDVLDLLGETGEPLTFYCIHDADAYGTMIYQSLQQATRARPGRKVEIVNLGLEPAEAMEMGLQVEKVGGEDSAKQRAVADYVDAEWSEWLQTKRVELNAMTTPQLLEWLDRKFAPFAGKVEPPADVQAGRLRAEVEGRLRTSITDRVLAEADVDGQVEDALVDLGPTLEEKAAVLPGIVAASLADNPALRWSSPVAKVAAEVAGLAEEEWR